MISSCQERLAHPIENGRLFPLLYTLSSTFKRQEQRLPFPPRLQFQSPKPAFGSFHAFFGPSSSAI